MQSSKRKCNLWKRILPHDNQKKDENFEAHFVIKLNLLDGAYKDYVMACRERWLYEGEDCENVIEVSNFKHLRLDQNLQSNLFAIVLRDFFEICFGFFREFEA